MCGLPSMAAQGSSAAAAAPRSRISPPCVRLWIHTQKPRVRPSRPSSSASVRCAIRQQAPQVSRPGGASTAAHGPDGHHLNQTPAKTSPASAFDRLSRRACSASAARAAVAICSDHSPAAKRNISHFKAIISVQTYRLTEAWVGHPCLPASAFCRSRASGGSFPHGRRVGDDAEGTTVESPFWQKPARPARRMARRPQWRAPENQPLLLGETSIADLAARPRAIIASFGMVILLGVGVVTALTVEDTGGLLAEAETSPVSEPAKPVTAPLPFIRDTNATAADTTKVAQAAEGKDPAVEPSPQAIAPAPRLPAAKPVTLVKISQAADTAVTPAGEVLNHDDPRWARIAVAAQPVPVTPVHEISADGSGVAAFAGS